MGKRTISSAWTTPPAAIIAACPAACGTEVGRVTVTSMIATLPEAMIPAVGPTAHSRPAAKVHTASRARNSPVCEAPTR